MLILFEYISFRCISLRFRQHNIRLVVCVDELAASGGYMMACCGHRILCSPFAAVGSIGVRLARKGF